MSQPLEGIRVLDLTRLLPGPLCALMLADLGADVIKVETPEGGDYTRWFPPIRQQMSAAFAALNRNKRSLALDLKRPEGVEALLRLVERADILLEGFRPGVLKRLGLGLEVLHERNPKLIVCAITGYGQDGPMALKAGHDLNYLARAGVLSLQGEQSRVPFVPGVQVGDIAGGSYLACSSILAALFRRERTGEGAFCDVSMTEGLLPFLTMELGNMSAGAPVPLRGDDGPLRGGVPCYGVYRCKDGKALSVGSLEPKFWMVFVGTLGLPHLVSELLETGESKVRVQQEIEAVLVQKDRAEWIEIFSTVDACVEPVLELDEVLEDAHFQARESFVEHEHPTEGLFRLPRSPLRLSEMDTPVHTGAPLLGEQSEEILREAGFLDEEIASLREKGCIL